MRLAAALVAAALALAFPPQAPGEDRLTTEQVLRVAEQDPNVVEQRRQRGSIGSTAARVDGAWEVSYFDRGKRVALVIVDPASGEVRESWTGHQVDWKMARGYSGAFGRGLNAPYVFLPLCGLFLIGLLDWRRPWRGANLDLLALLGFGVSHWFFNRGEIGVSVPLQYPVLAYLLARSLWIGLRGRGQGLRPVWPAAWLLVAALFLIGVRVGLNVSDSSTIDVGYASVVGAERIASGEPLYGSFPAGVPHGDTYGPVNYLAYVLPEAIWPWSGSWDDLPAAHGGAVLFDLATMGMLALLGLRMCPGRAGRRLAATLVFGWAAFPYTAFVLESNSNDSLVAALLVATLLVAARPVARGVTLAAAALTKFAPLLLVPLLARYRPRGARAAPVAIAFATGFGLAAATLLLWPAIDPGLPTVFDRTLAYQAERDSPFSIWGQVSGLEPLRVAILVAVIAMSLAFAFRPRDPSLVQLAALGSAVIIGLQLTTQHWFYLYIVWFYPLFLIATAANQRVPDGPDG